MLKSHSTLWAPTLCHIGKDIWGCCQFVMELTDVHGPRRDLGCGNSWRKLGPTVYSEGTSQLCQSLPCQSVLRSMT